MRKLPFRRGPAAAIAVFVALTACGSSPSTTNAPAGGTAACVSQATQAANKVKGPLALKAPPSPVNMKSLAGKSVWLISAVQDEFNQTVGNSFIAAATAAGLKSRYVEAEGQVTKMGQLVQEAVTAQASGIVLFNIDPNNVSGPLAAAKSAGITVIDFNNGNPTDPLPAGVFAHVADDFAAQGKDMADWMLADSGCNLHLAQFVLPTFPIDTDLTKATEAEINSLCPSCTVVDTNFDITTFQTTLAPLALTVARRYPTINYMSPAFDAFDGLISPALQQIGSKIKLVGHDGNVTNLAAMRAGSTLQVMTDATPPENYIGWALLDQLARGITGSPAVDWALPGRLVDKTNIGQSDAELFPAYQNFQSHFTSAWGVG
ncbi:MAG: sugar ABC transporter substrate-binding protein [Candidatus Dormibacteraceae bacterium]